MPRTRSLAWAELKIGLRQPSMDGAAICQTGAISLSRIAVHA